MTGYDIYKRARSLLRLSKETVFFDREAENSASLEILNQLLLDLKCGEVTSLSEELKISETKKEALAYGVAMLTALTLGDGGKNSLFTQLYNAKRSMALAELTHIRDVLPTQTEV